jgi:hypothetical protein
MESVIEQLHALLEKHRSIDYECPTSDASSFECGSMMPGALTRELDRMTLLSPRPEVPFAERSFSGLCDTFKRIKSPQWSEYKSNSADLNHYKYGSPHSGRTLHVYNFEKTVEGIVATAYVAVVGLDLSEMEKREV